MTSEQEKFSQNVLDLSEKFAKISDGRSLCQIVAAAHQIILHVLEESPLSKKEIEEVFLKLEEFRKDVFRDRK